MGELRIRVTGRNVDVGDALRGRITDDLTAGISRYVTRDGEGVVTLTKERHLYRVEITVHLDSGISLEAEGEANDAHPAFDAALEKMEKRVRRYKRRLKDHHANEARITAASSEPAAYAIIETEDEADAAAESGESGDGAPMIIAEARTDIRTMAVSTAVMQLELGDRSAIMFRNPSTGVLNVVYRRADGNIGWIDPGRAEGGARDKAA
jgi:ribosomal subunit interface protein